MNIREEKILGKGCGKKMIMLRPQCHGAACGHKMFIAGNQKCNE